MRKYITFVLDSFGLPEYEEAFFGDETFCYSFLDTDQAIKAGISSIWTYDIMHLSFDLIDLGYVICIAHKGKFLEVKPGMNLKSGKELRYVHNLRRILMAGAMNEDLDLEDVYPTAHVSAEYAIHEKNRLEDWDNLRAQQWVNGEIIMDDKNNQ